MKRREFITLLGGAAAWPLAARGQQGERMRRIGVLLYLAEDDSDSSARVAAFQRGLRELGWMEGSNVRIDYRWGGGDLDRVRRYAAELVGLAPDVILVSSGSALAALQNATRTVPIVFVNVSDPVGAGYVASLSQPGNNTTGFTLFEYSISGKWLRATKRDSAPDDPSGSHSKSIHNVGNWPVRRNPGGGSIARGRIDADRCA
jgi:putative ABC transport system substrate-binding protein